MVFVSREPSTTPDSYRRQNAHEGWGYDLCLLMRAEIITMWGLGFNPSRWPKAP